jgi:hypothetical protein
MLIQGSVGDLRRYAEGLGFRPDPDGYVSACHLCGAIRTWLYLHFSDERRPSELAPRFFYEEMARLSSRSNRDADSAGEEATTRTPR